MSFTIPLKTPIDPKNRKIVLKIYDPTFYIAMDYQKNNPVSATGPMPAMCKVELKPVPSDSEVMQTKKLLANKSKEWQPKTEEDFGALFAQPVLLDCVSKSAS